MKNNYQKPEIEILLISLEAGACTTASNTENFNITSGTWENPSL